MNKTFKIFAGILAGSCAFGVVQIAEAATVRDGRVNAIYSDSANPYGTHQGTITLGSGAKIFVTIPSDNPISSFYLSSSNSGSPDVSVFRLYNPLSHVSNFVRARSAVADTSVSPQDLDDTQDPESGLLDGAKGEPSALFTPASESSQSSDSVSTVGSGSGLTSSSGSLTGTLSAVPLPPSLPLFAAGLLALGAVGYGLGARQRGQAGRSCG